MRIAAISDTHGDLERINTIARETETEQNLDFLRDLQSLQTTQVTLGRGRKVPAWVVNLNYLNLPDASEGYAVFECTDGHVNIQTQQHS